MCTKLVIKVCLIFFLFSIDIYTAICYNVNNEKQIKNNSPMANHRKDRKL